ncbi:MAG: hypothetical protein EPN50_07105 [Chloroflexota bacterium]|nr:MAG: hypothetical protein EPN50_07105 [Chloroflexota bacterium]
MSRDDLPAARAAAGSTEATPDALDAAWPEGPDSPWGDARADPAPLADVRALGRETAVRARLLGLTIGGRVGGSVG